MRNMCREHTLLWLGASVGVSLLLLAVLPRFTHTRNGTATSGQSDITTPSPTPPVDVQELTHVGISSPPHVLEPNVATSIEVWVKCTASDTGLAASDLLVLASDSKAALAELPISAPENDQPHAITDVAGVAYLGRWPHTHFFVHVYDKTPSAWLWIHTTLLSPVTSLSSSDAVHSIVLDVGPTFTLAMSLPDGYAAADFSASLTGDIPLIGCIGAVREHAYIWARIVRKPPPTPEQQTLSLTVESLDHLWIGAAPVPRNYDPTRSVVDITLSALGSISGVVLNEEGAPIENARMLLVDVTNSTSTRAAVSDIDGRFTLIARPGQYYIQVLADSLKAIEMPIDIVPGRGSQEYRFVMESLVLDRIVSGSITSTSGTFCEPTRVIVYPGPSYGDVVWDLTTERAVGSFRVHCVRTEQYEVVLVSDGVRFDRWSPVSDVVKEGEEAEFNICDVDLGVSRCLTVSFSDGQQYPPSAIRLAFTVSGIAGTTNGVNITTSAMHAVVHSAAMPGDTVYGVVMCDGYVPLLVDDDDFREASCAIDTTAHSGRVTLARGNGRVICVKDGAGVPMSDIEIAIGDTYRSRTNRAGLAVMETTDLEMGCEILSDGYTLIPSNDFAADGTHRRAGQAPNAILQVIVRRDG